MRRWVSAVMTIIFMGLGLSQIHATPLKIGSTCLKINQFQQSGSTLLVCSASKGKKTWRKASSVEKTLYLREQKRIQKANADKIAQEAKLQADIIKAVASELARAAAEKAAAEKAAAEKAAAEKAAAAKCALLGVDCRVGDTGPGGGIVFYDAGSQQSWGRYLEFAPSGWSGSTLDPSAAWCNRNIYLRVNAREVGAGKANTNLMLAGCSSGAAVLARSYRGGGKADWSLPSTDEIRELFKHVSSKAEPIPGRQNLMDVMYGGFDMRSTYWASFDYDADYAHDLYFASIYGVDGGQEKENLTRVRPVRSF